MASPASSLSLSCSDKSLLRCLGDPRPRLTVTSFLADRKHILIKRGRWGRRSRRKSIRAETSVRALAAANPASFGPALISACCLSVCVCFSGRIACGTFTLAALFLLKQQQQQQRSDRKVDGLKTTPSRTDGQGTESTAHTCGCQDSRVDSGLCSPPQSSTQALFSVKCEHMGGVGGAHIWLTGANVWRVLFLPLFPPAIYRRSVDV